MPVADLRPDLPLRLLDTVGVASPCPMRWDDMEGDGPVRHCGQCELNVYNVSEMPADEAEALLRQTEGRLCIRLYRRADGTIITCDCPVGLRAARQRLVRLGLRVAAVLAFVLTGGHLARATTREEITRLTDLGPIDRAAQVLRQYLPGAAPPRRLPRSEMGGCVMQRYQ